MKKYLSLLLIILFSISLFAQTNVDAKKLGKMLESNKDSSAVFTCYLSLTGMKVSSDGTVTLSALAKNKVKIVSDMDMTNITERIAYARKTTYTVIFESRNVREKIYAITNIAGIETVKEYESRKAEEARIAEEKCIAEEKERWERDPLANLTKHPVQVINLEIDNLGKITTVKFAVFIKLRKTESGYTISVDFTDLTTGEQLASCSSKEYPKAEYLYGPTGVVDELTLALANKLNIKISDLNKNLLTSGFANFTVDAQLALAEQN